MNALHLAPALYIVAVLSSVVLVAAAATAWCSDDLGDRALVGGLAATSLLVGVPLLLGMAGLLSQLAYLFAMGGAGAVAAIALGRRPPRKRAPMVWSKTGLAALGISVALAVLSFVPTIKALSSGDTETRRYHISNLVFWARHHTIWPLPFQNPGLFTSTHPGGEIAMIGMLFPTGRDELVYTNLLLYGAVAIVACAALARDLGGREGTGALVAVAFLASPIVYATQAHALMTDLAAAAPLLAGLACAVRARRRRDARWVLAAGAGFGLGLGAKYTVLVLVPVAVAATVLMLGRERRAWWLVPGPALFGGPWLIRNWLATGNPIYPEGFRLFGVQLLRGGQSPLVVYATTMASHVVHARSGPLATWWHLFWHYWGPSFLIPLAGLALALVRRSGEGMPVPHGDVDRMLLVLLTVTGLLAYVATPYTGAGPGGVPALMGSNLRYLLPAALSALPLGAALIPPIFLGPLVGVVLGFDALSMVRGYGFRTDLDLHPAGLAAALIVAFIAVVSTHRGLGRALSPGLLATGGAAAGCAAFVLVLSTIDRHEVPTPLEHLVAETGATRVAVVGADDFRSVLGPDLSNDIVGVVGGRPPGDPPPPTTAQLDAAVERAPAPVLVVKTGTPGVPPGWQPPGWKLAGSTGSGTVYVRPSPPPVPRRLPGH